jgi:hypothetical protein
MSNSLDIFVRMSGLILNIIRQKTFWMLEVCLLFYAFAIAEVFH